MKKVILTILIALNPTLLMASEEIGNFNHFPHNIGMPQPTQFMDAQERRYPIAPSPEAPEQNGFFDQLGDAVVSIFNNFASPFAGIQFQGWPYIVDEDDPHEVHSEGLMPREQAQAKIISPPTAQINLPQFGGDVNRLLKNIKTKTTCQSSFENLSKYLIESFSFEGCHTLVLINFINFLKTNDAAFLQLKSINCKGHKLDPQQISDLLAACSKRASQTLEIDLSPGKEYDSIALASLAGRYCIRNAALKIKLSDISLPKNFQYLSLPKGLIIQGIKEIETDDLARDLTKMRSIMKSNNVTVVYNKDMKLILKD